MNTLTHHHPRITEDTILVTRQAAVFLGAGTTVGYLRRKCQPIACDVTSRAALYNLDTIIDRFPPRTT